MLRRAAMILTVLVLSGVLPATAAAPSPRRPVTTYSIVARDAATGQLGVAVQSHWFSVGTTVVWARAGIGAVATQSFVDPAYGPRLLALLDSGMAAPDALAALVGADSGRDVRQVGVVDALGRVAAHTGARCIESAAHRVGDGYSVQANMMAHDTVVPAMARAYESATGDLTDRLLTALEAAQGEGGDIRGRQSAAILVVRGQRGGQPWADRLVDLRVEDNPRPVAELRRLVDLHRAYEHMNRGDVAVEHGDLEGALAEYGAAAAIAPDNLEITYWHAVTLATNGREAEAVPLFRKVFAADPGWVELTRRLIRPGVVPDTPEGRALVDRIVALSP